METILLIRGRLAQGRRVKGEFPAVQEGFLRKSFLRNGKLIDQVLWAIIDEDWYRSKAVWGAKIN